MCYTLFICTLCEILFIVRLFYCAFLYYVIILSDFCKSKSTSGSCDVSALPNLSFYLEFWSQTHSSKTVCSCAAGSRQHTSPDRPCERSAPLLNTANTHTHCHKEISHQSWRNGQWVLLKVKGSALFFCPLLLWMDDIGMCLVMCVLLTLDPCLSLCVEINRSFGQRVERGNLFFALLMHNRCTYT